MTSRHYCSRTVCPDCERGSGCECQEAWNNVKEERCVHCKDKEALARMERMRELNQKLDALGVTYRPSKNGSEESST